MDSKEILKFCLENGLLLDNEVLNLFSDTNDLEFVKLIIRKIKTYTREKIITKNVFNENKDHVNQFFLTLPKENQKKFESLKIKLGLSIEISRTEISDLSAENQEEKLLDNTSINEIFETTSKSNEDRKINLNNEFNDVKIVSMAQNVGRKVQVKDFVKYFRNRLFEIKNMLQEHSELTNLISINKISGNSQRSSIIGIVSSKRITKNKNILFEIEDLTGKIRVLINQNKPELYKKAEEISLDSVLGFSGSGNREIFFVNEIIFPEAKIFERKKSPIEKCALFIGDLHFGSKLFLRENFLKFINYLNGEMLNTPEVEKIKYLFIVGDLITGVGNYPNQERDLAIIDIEEQFVELSKLLDKIRKDIKIIISPGNHDGVRIMEPQPIFDEKYAWPLYSLKNVLITGNPSRVNIGATENFDGFNVLTYHGFSFPFYANTVSSLMLEKALNTPNKIMNYLLKNRHLAPTHASTQYFPSEKDFLLIEKIPDIFIAGHTHKSAVSYYNNILTVSVSSWESKTSYQEKMGNQPDHCKVPMFNLKTREIKILDFE